MRLEEEIRWDVPGPLTLRLRRYAAADRRELTKRKRAVLMLHGGNSSSDTYLLPNGGLAKFLTDEGWAVWLLDYRASPFVQNALVHQGVLGGSLAAERALFTLDKVVEVDIPEALSRVRAQMDDELSVLGHCIGGGSVALAIARGALTTVRNVVLSALGLFYEVPWNGWVKAEDYLIERVLSSKPECRAIDPKDLGAWPQVLKDAYGAWPRTWLPNGKEKWHQMLSQLTFMFGQPYFLAALDPSLRGDALLPVFGNMHTGLYGHISQMVRRGYAGKSDAPDVVDRPRLPRNAAPRARPGRTGDLASGSKFKDKVVTLISGTENRLWHRDSMDLMYEWLVANARGGDGAVFKQVYPGYGLQEIVWGEHARVEVFPGIEKALRGEPH